MIMTRVLDQIILTSFNEFSFVVRVLDMVIIGEMD